MRITMGHSFIQNYGHLVYHTRKTTIRTEDLVRVHMYLRAMLENIGATDIVVGGIEDHIHILANFPVVKPIPDIVQRLKIDTTYWLRSMRASYRRFSWQTGYGYFSVSAPRYRGVAKYIINQRKHHADMSTDEEFDRLVAESRDPKYIRVD